MTPWYPEDFDRLSFADVSRRDWPSAILVVGLVVVLLAIVIVFGAPA